MPEGLRWGILGTARINRRTVPGIRAAGHALAIVGSRDLERAQAAAIEYGAERAGTYDDVVAARDVDVLYVSLPNSLHAPWVIRAAEAGKNVLCEKPLAPTVADCEAMAAAAERHGIHLVEAFMYRHHPQWKVVQEVLDSGRIGPVRLLRATWTFRLRDRQNIRLSSELGGGALQDVGCYCINLARWFLGEPTRVRGIASDQQGVGVDTHSAAVLEFASGALAVLTCSFETTNQQVMEIIGERGRIEVPSAFVSFGDTRVRIVDPDDDRTEIVPATDVYALQIAAMGRLIRGGVSSFSPASDAALTQAVIAAWRQGT
ncbi:MAG TPA: Gfo/Idh/MocA family oxidoreductase [Chloroflexota bacterium]|nr:Gfo/Idh/MocA family oxidoreductase [Chloroflexota bacterium]